MSSTQSIDDFDVSVDMAFRILDKMGVGEYVFLGICEGNSRVLFEKKPSNRRKILALESKPFVTSLGSWKVLDEIP